MSIIDKITIYCNDVNKASTSVELLVRYSMLHVIKSNVGLRIKSTAGLKTFVENCNVHNAFAHPLNFAELLQ